MEMVKGWDEPGTFTLGALHAHLQGRQLPFFLLFGFFHLITDCSYLFACLLACFSAADSRMMPAQGTDVESASLLFLFSSSCV
jgi:hypothetical protein